jgi:hypothetical protein
LYYIVYRYRLRCLRQRKRKLNLLYHGLYEKAKAEKQSRDQVDGILSERSMEIDFVDDDIAELVTRRLIDSAEDNLIPVPTIVVPPNGEEPTDDAAWIRSRITERWQLSMAAAADLRTAIRKEKRERSELAFRYLAGLTGIIGTLIGFVALLAKVR